MTGWRRYVAAMRTLFILLLILPGLAAAEIYRWVDEDGVVHYGDRPPGDAERVELPDLQRMDPVATQAGDAGERAQTPPADLQVRIERPQPEETFRDPRGLVPAAASLSRDLAPGQRLVFYLDGEAVGAPTRNRSLQLEGVTRGEHRLSVAVTEEDEEISRSAPVTFFMHQPSASSPAGGQGGGAPAAPPSGNTQGAPGAPRPGTGAGSTP